MADGGAQNQGLGAAGQDMAGQGMAGQGMAGQGMAGRAVAGQGMGVLARIIALARGDVLAAPYDLGAGGAASLGGDDLPPLGQVLGFAGADGAAGAQTDAQTRAWRMALARSARDQLKMTVGFSDVTARQASLTEVLETPMQRALIVMLQGAGEGMGLLVISGQMLAAMIEILTLMRLAPNGPQDEDLRKPTRTDAAMAVEFIDAVMAGFERVLTEGDAGGSDWATGYRYAAFIDDPRPLHLMLEECDYHLLSAQIALEDGNRRGDITLALPVPAPAVSDFIAPLADISFDLPPADDGPIFTAQLAQKVQDLPVQINAAIAQIHVPLERIVRLQVGEVIALPLAGLDKIAVLGLDGQRIAGGRLGQNRGMRALRLTDLPQTSAAPRDHMQARAHSAANGLPAALPGVLPNDAHTAEAADNAQTPDFSADFTANFNAEMDAGFPDFPSLQTAV